MQLVRVCEKEGRPHQSPLAGYQSPLCRVLGNLPPKDPYPLDDTKVRRAKTGAQIFSTKVYFLSTNGKFGRKNREISAEKQNRRKR